MSLSSSATVETAATEKPIVILPWRTRLVVSLISVVSDAARRPNGTINRRLLNLVDFKAAPSPSKPSHSVLSSDVTVDPTRSLWFRIYTPTTSAASAAASLPVFIFFHGGGFSYLSAGTRSYDLVCRKFAHLLLAVVISVNYRLTPEHRFPSQYEDGFDVLRFLDDERNAGILPPNADLSKCFLAGDSAGANLAHHVAVRACRNQFRSVKLVGLVSIQPFFGGEERTESEIRLEGSPLVSMSRTDWAWKVFLPVGSDRDHYAVNVSGPNAEEISGLDGFPETVVFVGGLDPLQDWQRRYSEWLKKSGKVVSLIEYPSMIHAFYIFPELPQSSQLLRQVKDFVASRLRN